MIFGKPCHIPKTTRTVLSVTIISNIYQNKNENQAMGLGDQSKIVMLVKFIAEQGAIDISQL